MSVRSIAKKVLGSLLLVSAACGLVGLPGDIPSWYVCLRDGKEACKSIWLFSMSIPWPKVHWPTVNAATLWNVAFLLVGILLLIPEPTWGRMINGLLRRGQAPHGVSQEEPLDFASQIREFQRRFRNPYGHELCRLLPELLREIQSNLERRSNNPERHYLDGVLAHIRLNQHEDDDRELTDVLSVLAQRYSRVSAHQPLPLANHVLAQMSAPRYTLEAKEAETIVRRAIGDCEQAIRGRS